MILWRSIQRHSAERRRPPTIAPPHERRSERGDVRPRAAVNARLVESCVCEYGRESFCFEVARACESAPGLAGATPGRGSGRAGTGARRDRAQQQEEGGPVWDSDMLFFNLLQTGSSEKQV